MKYNVLLQHVVDACDETVTADTVRAVFTAFTRVVETKSAENTLVIPGLCTISQVDVAARKGINPSTHQEMIIPAHRRTKVALAKSLRVNCGESDS